MKVYNYIAILSFLLVGCGNGKISETIIPNNFPIEVRKSTPLLGLDTTPVQNILIKDGKLILRMKYDYPYFSIYDLTTNEKLSSFGSKNDSVMNLDNPYLSGSSFKVQTANDFYITDKKNHRFLTLNIKSIVKNKPAKAVSTVGLPIQFLQKYNNVYRFSKDVYCGDNRGAGQKGRFFIFDYRTKKTSWVPYYPNPTKELSDEDRVYYYYSFNAFNDSLNILGAAMKFFKRVEFYNNIGELKTVNEFEGEEKKEPKFVSPIIQDPDVMVYYNESYAGKKYFYATLINASQQQYAENKGFMQLHVFNWNGTLVKIIQLDRIFLGSFAVDEEKDELYIISFVGSDKDHMILKYSLK